MLKLFHRSWELRHLYLGELTNPLESNSEFACHNVGRLQTEMRILSDP